MKEKIIDKMATLTTAAFSLVAALAWNGAVKSLFEKYYSAGEGVMAMFIYAFTITILSIAVIIFIEKASEKAKKTELNEIKEISNKMLTQLNLRTTPNDTTQTMQVM